MGKNDLDKILFHQPANRYFYNIFDKYRGPSYSFLCRAHIFHLHGLGHSSKSLLLHYSFSCLHDNFNLKIDFFPSIQIEVYSQSFVLPKHV